MPRLSGVDIPEAKKTFFALTSIYGIGRSQAGTVLKLAHIDAHKRAKNLSSDEVSRIQRALDNIIVEGDLRRQVNENIDRLKRTKSYRGIRLMVGLPARGQRTRSNARTNRGKRRTVGAMTKEMAAKLETAKKAKG